MLRKKKLKIRFIIGAVMVSLPIGLILLLMMLVAFIGMSSASPEVLAKTHEIPYKALKDAAQIYADTDIDWLGLLAVYAADSGCDWEEYNKSDIKDIAHVIKMKQKANPAYDMGDYVVGHIVNQKDYYFFYENYRRIYGELINVYTYDGEERIKRYYYNCFFPIARHYSMQYSDDFMDERDFGDITWHDGNDIVAGEDTPIIAVEAGEIETIGWNAAGGWRIGIRSGDRFWYYAHLRKVHPYYRLLCKGESVRAGQVIGYVGSTGYSDSIPADVMPNEDSLTYPGVVDSNMIKHLHIGLKVRIKIGDETGDDIEQWVNPYSILKFLESSRISVHKETITKVIDGEEIKEETGDYISEHLDREARIFGELKIRN